jgi:septal ring factor EnvC (AmiA/AmiB activator)
MDEKLSLDNKEMHKPPEELMQDQEQDQQEPQEQQHAVDPSEDLAVKDLQEKIDSLLANNENLAKELKEAQDKLVAKREEEAAFQRQWDEQSALLTATREENMRVLEKRVEPGCSNVVTECSNLGPIRNALVHSVAELQEGIGHELVELRYLFNDETRRVQSQLDPFNSQATELG